MGNRVQSTRKSDFLATESGDVGSEELMRRCAEKSLKFLA